MNNTVSELAAAEFGPQVLGDLIHATIIAVAAAESRGKRHRTVAWSSGR